MLSKKELILKNYDEIKEVMFKTYKEMEGCPQGMRSDICINIETEEVYATSLLGENTETKEVLEGKAIVLASVQSW